VVCWRHLPALLRSRRLPIFARLELLLFLLLPAVFMPVGLISIINWLVVLFFKDWDGLNTVSLLIWYLFGFRDSAVGGGGVEAARSSELVAIASACSPVRLLRFRLVHGRCDRLLARSPWPASVGEDAPRR
jgi:hypothetical protein